jgi:hypothetical protein
MKHKGVESKHAGKPSVLWTKQKDLSGLDPTGLFDSNVE